MDNKYKNRAWRVISASLAWVVALGLASCARWHPTQPEGASMRQRTLLDADWRFHRGEPVSTNQITEAVYDDAQWQQVQLPHDYQLDGVYDPTNSRRCGYLPTD